MQFVTIQYQWDLMVKFALSNILFLMSAAVPNTWKTPGTFRMGLTTVVFKTEPINVDGAQDVIDLNPNLVLLWICRMQGAAFATLVVALW